MTKILIIGFGRMGFTHLAHINGLLSENCEFDVFDPSQFFRTAAFFKLRRNVRFLRRIPTSGSYDHVVITSPPVAHSSNFRAALDLGNSFFIEKPLALTDEDLVAAQERKKKITCGYVLRRNPCIAHLAKLTSNTPPDFILVDVRSNLGLQQGEDWRFDLKGGGGCINELGSHAINLGLALQTNGPDLAERLRVRDLSVPTFDISISSKLQISGNWNEDVRKTTYNVVATGSDYELRTDLQSISGTYQNNEFEWSPRQEELSVGYYMRGIDFALQAEAFLFGPHDDDGLRDAVLTDKLLGAVLAHD